MEHDDKTRTSINLVAGSELAQYRIINKIGAGGMGEVYLAEDKNLDRKVALKFLPAAMASDGAVKARFVREARAAAKLNHPHIVTVYEVGEFKGRPFIAMEYVEGKLLYDLIGGEPQPVDTVLEYAVQLCQGLGEAHRAGIIHRDIKSSNIAIDKNGRTRILDFGLAAVQGTEQLTKTGSTLGTVSYMSPEQVSGRDIDNRSDLFSLGVVLYELIAGRTPFKRNSEGASLKAIMEDDPEPLTRYRANVPEAMQTVISKLLEKDREVRYQSAEGVLADLKKMLYDSQPASKSTSRQPARSKVVPLVVTAAVVLAVAFIGWKVFFSPKPEVSTTERSPVLAVLSFKNLGSTEDEYFSEGITDEIRSRLVGIEGLRVISSNSTEKYKKTDKSIGEIGQDLGADYILEGTIRWDKSGDVDRIRIGPRLTKTSDNYLMWADNYDQKLVQVFDVQSEIAGQIVTALGLTLLEPGKPAPEYAPTTNMQAYNYYLRGLELNSKGIFMTNLNQVIKMYDSAIALDPNFALAWAKKSIAHSLYEFSFTGLANSQNASKSLEAAEQALLLDPGLPEAHIALGTYYNWIERDYNKALDQFALAQSEVTSNADLSEAIGVVKMRQGHWQEALEYFEESARLDPLTVRRYFYLAMWHSFNRQMNKAQLYIDRALALSPGDFESVHLKIEFNLMQYGSVDSKIATFEDIVKTAGIAGVSLYEVGPSMTPGYWRYVIDRLDPDEVISELRSIDRSSTSPYLIHMNVAQIFDLTGRDDSARLYYDSARVLLELTQQYGDEDFHVSSNLGLAYAYLGMHDEAIAAAQRGKELMSVDDCHW